MVLILVLDFQKRMLVSVAVRLQEYRLWGRQAFMAWLWPWCQEQLTLLLLFLYDNIQMISLSLLIFG